MADKVLRCVICGKPASLVVIATVNGFTQEIYLCAQHTMETGIGATNPGNALSINKVERIQTTLSPCPACGYTQNDLQASGRLGCPSCYETFYPLLQNSLSPLEHLGKIPKKAWSKEQVSHRIEHWKEQMQKAVEIENYEDAAIYRDRIKDLNDSLKIRKQKEAYDSL